MTEKEFKIEVLPMSSLVYPMARRLLQTNEAAKDAVQLSMMKLWENRKKLNECKSIKAFVFRVVRNTCLDELKKKQVLSLDENDKVLNTRLTQSDYDQKEAAGFVLKLIKSLPDGQKEVIQMRDIDGLEFDEIAEILDYDLPYIRVLLSRARKTIKSQLIKIYDYEAVGK